jgi:predicted phosphodiesterase
MTSPPIAVLSDVHGNRWALEAVLDDIRRRGIRDLVNLGDSLYGPLDPAGTAQILMALALPTVRGNEDRILLEKTEQHPGAVSLPFVRESLRPEHVAWLGTLPFSACLGDYFFLCHGTPERDDDYLLHEVTAAGCRRRPVAAVALKLAAVVQPIACCGHDHLPVSLRLPGGRHVVNPGSVGLPAYRDDQPFPHAMQSGSPHARYSIVTRSPSGLSVENIVVAYDWSSAAAVAVKNGRPDWAEYLRTGRVF